MPRYKNPQQGTFLDQDGNVIEEKVQQSNNHWHIQDKTLEDTQNILTRTVEAPQSLNILSKLKNTVSKALLKKELKTKINIAWKDFDLQIKPVNDDSIDSLSLQIKLRLQWEKQYETFEADFAPISFQKFINRSDNSAYYRLSPLIYRRIIKTGGKKWKVFGARWSTSDENANISSFSYFFYVFDLPRYQGWELQASIHKQLFSFIQKYYVPGIED